MEKLIVLILAHAPCGTYANGGNVFCRYKCLRIHCKKSSFFLLTHIKWNMLSTSSQAAYRKHSEQNYVSVLYAQWVRRAAGKRHVYVPSMNWIQRMQICFLKICCSYVFFFFFSFYTWLRDVAQKFSDYSLKAKSRTPKIHWPLFTGESL